MSLTKNDALELIYAGLSEINAERAGSQPLKLVPETRLIGSGHDLDSLEVVNLVVGLEARLAARLTKPVVLVNEEALGSGHVFRDVNSLAEYIVRLTEA